MTSLRAGVSRLQERPEVRRLLQGFGWSFLGVILGRVATLLASIWVARALGREAYGEFALLQSTTVMLGELGGLGVSVAAAKLLGQFRDHHPERASGVITLNLVVPAAISAVLASLLWYWREPLAVGALDNARLSPLISFIAVSLFFATITGAIAGILNGLEQFRASASLSLIISVLTAAVQMLVVESFGIEGVLVAGITANLLGVLLGWRRLVDVLADRRLHLDFRSARQELPTLWAVNIPAMASALMVVPVTWLASVLLVRQPQGYAEMAAFNIANQWKMALMIAPTVLGNVLLPTLARLAGGTDLARYQRAIRWQLLANGVGALLVVMVMCALAPWLLGFYGEDYADDVDVMWLLFVVAGLMAINTVTGNAITSAGHLWLGLWMNAAWALLLLVAAWMLCPRFGAAGLAAAYVIAYLGHTAWQSVVLRYFVFGPRSQ